MFYGICIRGVLDDGVNFSILSPLPVPVNLLDGMAIHSPFYCQSFDWGTRTKKFPDSRQNGQSLVHGIRSYEKIKLYSRFYLFFSFFVSSRTSSHVVLESRT